MLIIYYVQHNPLISLKQFIISSITIKQAWDKLLMGKLLIIKKGQQEERSTN
jgi:hypothetical protein